MKLVGVCPHTHNSTNYPFNLLSIKDTSELTLITVCTGSALVCACVFEAMYFEKNITICCVDNSKCPVFL